MSFIALLLAGAMLVGSVSDTALAADKVVGTRSGGAAPSSNHASTYVESFTYGVRMFLVPSAKNKSKETNAIVRKATGKEKNNSKLAKSGSVGKQNLEFAVNAATDANYAVYKKYSKNALYSDNLLGFIPSDERKHSKGIDKYSGDKKPFPSLGTIKIGGSGSDVKKVDDWIDKVGKKLNKRFGLPTGTVGKKKRGKQLTDVLEVFQRELGNISYIDKFDVTTDGGRVSSDFYLVTELVVGCVTNKGAKGILTARSYNCKGSCFYGGKLGGVCFGPGNKFEACAIRTSFMGADNFATCNLKGGKPGKRWDIVNPYSKMNDAQAKKYGGVGVYFGWASNTPPRGNKYAYIGATNFMITYDGAVGNTGEADSKIDADDVNAMSNFTFVKNLTERTADKDFDLGHRQIWGSDGDPICVDNEPTGSTKVYPANAYFLKENGVGKVSDNAHTLGISMETKEKLNSNYSKKNRMYAMYNIAPVVLGEEETDSSFINIQDLDLLVKDNKSRIKKALRLDWETKEYNEKSGSVFGQGQAFTLANVYAEDSKLGHTGTNGGGNDNQGKGELSSLGHYFVTLLYS